MVILCILLIALFIETIILITSKSLLIPYLTCSFKKQSLAIVACDDGSLKLEPVSGRDISETKRFGTLIFDRNYKYTLCGVPTFLYYSRGPCVSVSLETYIAAEKLRKLGVVANPEDRDGLDKTIRDAILTDHYRVLDAVKKYHWEAMSPEDRSIAEAEYEEFVKTRKEERENAYLSVGGMMFPGKCSIDENTGEIIVEEDFTRAERKAIEKRINEELPIPANVKEFVTARLTEEDIEKTKEKMKIECVLTPVDLSALYQYVPGFAGHVIQSRISMIRAEAYGKGIFGSMGKGMSIGTVVVLLAAIGLCGFLIMKGVPTDVASSLTSSFGSIGSSLAPAIDSAVNSTANITANMSTIAPTPTPAPTIEIRV